MDLEQVRLELEKGEALLIDVREENEWNEDHLLSAKLVPLSTLEELQIPSDLPKDRIIYTHCRKGGRACLAAEILKNNGFQAVPLKYAFEDLKKEYYPLGNKK